MKKTLSLLLAVFMVMTLIAVPAMATTQAGTFDVSYKDVLDLSSYADGTVLTNENVGATGVLSFAGTGSTARTTSAGKSYTYANLVDISTQATADSANKVSVATVGDEKVIRLDAAATNTNAGIGLVPVSGKTLLGGVRTRYTFDFYQPAQSDAFTSMVVGIAKIGPDGTLTYYDVNEFADSDPSGALAMTNFNPYQTAPVGANPLFYWESNMTKLYSISRMKCETGAFLGGSSFAHGANGFLNRVDANGNTVAVDSVAGIYDHWYSAQFGMQYLPGVGIKLYTMASYDVNEETWSNTQPYGTIALTDAEIAELENVQVVPVIALNSCGTANRYTYIKDVRVDVYATYNKADKEIDNVIMSDDFESETLNTQNNKSYNGSYIAAYGSFGNRCAQGGNSETSQWAEVVSNPSYVGNTSAQVLKIASNGKTASPWTGFRSQAIPTSAILSNEDGIIVSYDTYRTGASAGNGRLYFYGVYADGTHNTGTGSDSSDATKIMAHLTGSGNNVEFMFNNSNGNGANTLRFSANARENWTRIEFKLRAAADGTAIVNIRGCNLTTGVWSAWTSDITFPLNLTNYTGLVWAETYNNNTGLAFYYDNFKVYAADYSELPEIAGSDAFLVTPADNVTATFDSIIANKNAAKKAALKTADGEAVEAVVTVADVNGGTVLTFDPANDLEAEMDYYIDFTGLELLNGKAIINPYFKVQEDWATIENAPVVVYTGREKLVKGDKAVVTMNLDGSDLDTASFAVYSDSDAVAITANEDGTAYEITSVKDGFADIYVQSTLYPGAGVTKYEIQSVAAANTVMASFYDGEELLKVEYVPVNGVPVGYDYDNENFAGWALEEGGEVVSFTALTEDTNFYAVLNDLIDIEVAINDEVNAELIDTVITIPQGSTIPAAPEFVINNDAYTFVGFEVDGTIYTETQLLGLHFNEFTTITVVVAKSKVSIGEEIDFTTMTADEFGASGLAIDTDFVLTEGTGIELVKSAATAYDIYLAQGEATGAYVIEYDYIGSGSYGGYDGNIYGSNGAAKKLHGLYHTSGAFHELQYGGADGLSQSALASQNLLRYNDGEVHTVRLILDFDNNKTYLSQDGISSIKHPNANGQLAYIEAGAPTGFGMSMKTGGSFILTRFKYDHIESLEASTVTIEADENVTSFGMFDINNKVNINYVTKSMVAGEKIPFGYTIADAAWEIDEITATNGSVEQVDGVWYFTAGAEDAVVSIKTKAAYVTAIFNVGEGTLVSGETEQQLVKGQTPVAPEVTAPEGKIFLGWDVAIEPIYGDVTYNAVYTDAETVDITFVAENEDFAVLNTTVKAIKGGNLVNVPGYEALNGATFLYWQDAAGNHYTSEELAEKVFDGEETIEAVLKGGSINGVFDFTAHPFETFGGQVISQKGQVNDTEDFCYSVNEDGSVHIRAASGETHHAIISGTIKDANSGIWVLTLDLATVNPGSINGLTASSSKQNQGLFLVGDTVYVRSGDGTGGPVQTDAFKDLKISDGERHVIKAYYDFDNMTYRVSVDGKFAKIASNQISDTNIVTSTFNFFSNFEGDVYAFGVEKYDVTDKAVYTATAGSYEFSNSIGADIYSGTVYEGETVHYHASTPALGFVFEGWYLNDETEPYTTEYNFDYVPTADYKFTPKYVEDMMQFTFEVDGVNASFASHEGTTWSTGEFRKGLKPSAALEEAVPELVLAEGYVLVGWKAVENGAVFQPDTIANNNANGSVQNFVAIVRRAFNAEIGAPIVVGELGRTVELPVSADLTLPIAKGIVNVTFDDTVLEFVDAVVADAYAGKVVVAQTAVPNKLTITINSEEDIDIAGVLATLKFRTIAMTSGTEVTFTLTNVFAAEDEVLELVNKTYESGIVKTKALKGDVNVDGKIDVYDAVAVLRNIAGTISLTEAGLDAADVNADGNISVLDATQILKYVARIIAEF